MITKLKKILIKYFPALILFIVRQYIDLDFIKDLNPFTSETKEFLMEIMVKKAKDLTDKIILKVQV
jgi:hypothetical protein